MEITLRAIDADNWHACVKLTVSDEQKQNVAENAVSLAQAAYEKQWYPHGVYVDDMLVGFLMFGTDQETKRDGGVPFHDRHAASRERIRKSGSCEAIRSD